MNTVISNPPAFPISDLQAVHRIGAMAIEGITDPDERDRVYIKVTAMVAMGMTLRDYFAAKAMQALLREANSLDGNWHIEAIASYEIADAMLQARAA